MPTHYEMSSFGINRTSLAGFRGEWGQKHETTRERRAKRKAERKRRKRQ